MSERVALKCPICGVMHLEPYPYVGSTAWNDDCGCSDRGPCLMHSMDRTNMPVRPADDAMLERAKLKASRELQNWKEMGARFEACTASLVEFRPVIQQALLTLTGLAASYRELRHELRSTPYEKQWERQLDAREKDVDETVDMLKRSIGMRA